MTLDDPIARAAQIFAAQQRLVWGTDLQPHADDLAVRAFRAGVQWQQQQEEERREDEQAQDRFDARTRDG